MREKNQRKKRGKKFPSFAFSFFFLLLQLGPELLVGAVVDTVNNFTVPSPAVRFLVLGKSLETFQALAVVLVLLSAVLFEADLISFDLVVNDVTHDVDDYNIRKVFLFLVRKKVF